MGAGSSTAIDLPKCPSPFESVGNFTCVMPCPSEKGYERRAVQGGFRCVYKADSKYSTPLNTLTAVLFPGSTLADLQKKDVKAHTEFLKEQDRFVGEISILDGSIDKDKKIKDAFNRLQDAENVRDKTPEAYQQARSAYYTLLKGEKWIEQEKERLLKAEVEPIVQRYQTQRNATMRQFETQRRTIDVVNGLKDKVLSLKDAMKYSADTFTEQLNKVQTAINMDRRDKGTATVVRAWDWVDTMLNIAIVIGLLYVGWMIIKKIWFRPRVISQTTTVIQPTRVGVF